MRQSEILIIGGGIAGVSTACHLAQYGHDVTLLEQGELASEASGLNAGTIWATGWGAQPDLSSTLSMGSMDIFKHLQLDLGYDIEFRQSGSLHAIQTEEQYAFAQQEAHTHTASGHQVELLSARDARGIEPELSPHILGCLFYPHGANANPVKTVQALATLAQQYGANILTHSTVTGITPFANGSYQIEAISRTPSPTSAPAPAPASTAPGTMTTFTAHTLILAAGPWCRPLGAMLGLSIPVYPVCGQMWATAPQPPGIFHSIAALESHTYWHNHPYSDEQTPLELTHRQGQRLTRHLYGRQTRSGEIIIGGDRQLHDLSAPRTPDPTGIATNHAHALELFPFLATLPITRTWTGWMPFTRDLKPLIGKLPHHENLYLLTGLSSSGFEKGAMTGKLLAELVHGGVSDPVLLEAELEGKVGVQ